MTYYYYCEAVGAPASKLAECLGPDLGKHPGQSLLQQGHTGELQLLLPMHRQLPNNALLLLPGSIQLMKAGIEKQLLAKNGGAWCPGPPTCGSMAANDLDGLAVVHVEFEPEPHAAGLGGLALGFQGRPAVC